MSVKIIHPPVFKPPYTRVLGIDPSSKSGLVYIDGKEIYSSVLQNKKLKGIERVEWIRSTFATYLDTHHAINCAVIEGYAYANKYTLSMMVEIGINLRLALYQREIPCYICPPTTLKLYATGNGGAKKPEVAKGVRSKWGYENPSDDIIDAFCLAQIALTITNGGFVKGVEKMV